LDNNSTAGSVHSDVGQDNRIWQSKTPSYLNGVAANIIFSTFDDVVVKDGTF
jgi:hypothetical protein